MIPNQRRLSGLVLVLALLPSALSAQTVASTFVELQKILKPEEAVIVVDSAGRKTGGKVVELSTSSLLLQVGS